MSLSILVDMNLSPEWVPVLTVAGWTVFGCCPYEGTGRGKGNRHMDNPLQTIPLVGFNPVGELEIRLMLDGRVFIVCNFMPPILGRG